MTFAQIFFYPLIGGSIPREVGRTALSTVILRENRRGVRRDQAGGRALQIGLNPLGNSATL